MIKLNLRCADAQRSEGFEGLNPNCLAKMFLNGLGRLIERRKIPCYALAGHNRGVIYLSTNCTTKPAMAQTAQARASPMKKPLMWNQ